VGPGKLCNVVYVACKRKKKEKKEKKKGKTFSLSLDKHANEPYDEHSADLAGDKAARQKLLDGSSCFEVIGDVHEIQFTLAKCLLEKMKGWKEVEGTTVTPVNSMKGYFNAITELRKDVKGLPIVVDESAPAVTTLVGCKGPGLNRQYLGDLSDLIEVALSMSSAPKAITEASLKKECL
jgi:hypothetical protein